MESQEETSIEIVEEGADIALLNKSKKHFFDDSERRNACIGIAVFLILALISLFAISGWASDPSTFTDLDETLNEKKGNVMALVATTTSASTAISLLPEDAGASIADKLADFSTYFMIILAVIYLEKFLITTFGFLTFTFLIPGGCALIIISFFLSREGITRGNLQQVGAKLIAFGLALFLVVPCSVWVTNNIDNTFEASLQASNEATQVAIEELEDSVNESQEEQEEADFFSNLVSGVSNAVQSGFAMLTQGVQDALSNVGKQLNNLIDTLAVMIVTSCLIPLIVLALFLQLAKMISGVDFGGVSSIMSSARIKSRTFVSSLKKGARNS